MSLRRFIKLFGVSALSALALMVVVGVASASAFTNFNAETVPVKIKGTQTETAKFTTSAGTISCTNGTFEGEQTVTPSPTVTTSLSYSGCTFLGFIGVTVKPNECKYTFHASGTADVVCPTGKSIEFEAAGCNVKVGSQTGLTSIGYANAGTGSGRTVTVSPNVTNITYTTNSSCPGGAGTKSTGKYENGKTTVKGTNSKGGADGVFVS